MLSYEVVSFVNFKDMELKVVFEDPLNVSFGADNPDKMDKITIIMTSADIFFDPELGVPLKSEKPPLVPKQINVPP